MRRPIFNITQINPHNCEWWEEAPDLREIRLLSFGDYTVAKFTTDLDIIPKYFVSSLGISSCVHNGL